MHLRRAFAALARRQFVALALLLPLAVASCGTPAPTIDASKVRGKPLALTVQVASVPEPFQNVLNRYFVGFVVVEPASRKGQMLHFMIDGVSADWLEALTPASGWSIQADEEAFEQERKTGFSTWQASDLHAFPKELPKPPEPAGRTRH